MEDQEIFRQGISINSTSRNEIVFALKFFLQNFASKLFHIMPDLKHVYLLLGGNSGNVFQTLSLARSYIDNHVGNVVRHSNLYESEPWGMQSTELFINQALEITTDLPPLRLLHELLAIEVAFGRVREGSVPTSRTLDIDILLYSELVIQTHNLTIPHPRLHLRRFALMPLAELAPGIIHPIFGKSIAELLKECQDMLHVAILN